MLEIKPAQEYRDVFLELVKEYTDSILLEGSNVAQTLSYQNLDDELKDIDKKYGFPEGRMYVAFMDGEPAGCVALTRNGADYCEIKRLYVRPENRGKHISKALSEQVIADAREIGYKYMRLDTFPFMKGAIQLYESYGFKYIEKYNDNPADNAIFMQLTL